MQVNKLQVSQDVLKHLGEATDRRLVRTDLRGNSYLSISQVVTALNLAFNYDWDWDIIKYFKEENVMFCHGKLTARLYDENGNTHVITKEAIGGAVIIAKTYKDIYKSASSYAMKKAASYLNIGLDLAMKEEERLFALENNSRLYSIWTEETKAKHKDGWNFIEAILSNEIMTQDDINDYIKAWSAGSYLNIDMLSEEQFDSFIETLKAEAEKAGEE